MKNKQDQKSGSNSTNYQVGNDQYVALSGGKIHVEGQDIPTSIMSEIYTDLAKPGIIQVGKAIGTTLGLVNTFLYPMKYINKKTSLIYKNNFEILRKKLEKEDIENIVNIPPEIGKPLLEKLFYVSDEELAKLFINLLARASKKDSAHLAHPNFANIISSLSPDEARILNHLKGKILNIITPYSLLETKEEFDLENQSGVFFSELNNSSILIYPENINLYLINLSSLGILTSPYERLDYDIDENLDVNDCGLDELSERFKEELEKEHSKLGGEAMVRASKVEFTELGNFFLTAVT